MKNKKIKDLFEVKPIQWGLRGDPHLWKEMENRFGEKPLPSSSTDLKSQLLQYFEIVTGKQLKLEDSFFVERYAIGGMSSGMISPEAWIKTLIPFLLNRYEVICKKS